MQKPQVIKGLLGEKRILCKDSLSFEFLETCSLLPMGVLNTLSTHLNIDSTKLQFIVSYTPVFPLPPEKRLPLQTGMS